MAFKQELINQDLSRSIRALKINAEELIKVLKKEVKPWMDGTAAGRI
jgi:hypothetical protein